jgi:hypothetical protein
MRALDAVAYNAACDSMGFGRGKRLVVTPWQNLMRQWISFRRLYRSKAYPLARRSGRRGRR